MPSSSVHFPDGLLDALDRLAEARGVSRNRLVIEACRALLDQQARHWPLGFFDPPSPEDLAVLRGGDDFLAGIRAARQSRSEAPF